MTDPTIDEVRKVRREISAEVGPELLGLVERYTQMESRFKRPPLTPKDRRTIRYTEAAKQGDSPVENQSSPLGDR
jgi:hypothetical protein